METEITIEIVDELEEEHQQWQMEKIINTFKEAPFIAEWVKEQL